LPDDTVRDDGRRPNINRKLEAVRAYATLGEVNQALKDVFGEDKEPVKFG
jgi:methylmalonyl-CoA mutase N-terminal domain/subunit